VFVDLTAAYDTVWYRGLTCKLLQLLPDRHMVRMIMEMVGNHSFNLTTGNGKRSRLRRLKNGVPQGSVLAPLLFNTCISDLPTTVSRKYAYADDLAIMHADNGSGADQGHGNCRWIPPDLEAKTQHCKNGVGSLSSYQQGSWVWA